MAVTARVRVRSPSMCVWTPGLTMALARAPLVNVVDKVGAGPRGPRREARGGVALQRHGGGWRGPEVAGRREAWSTTFGAAEVAELRGAVDLVGARLARVADGVGGGPQAAAAAAAEVLGDARAEGVCAEARRGMPRVAAAMAAARREVVPPPGEAGRLGFYVVRGLPVQEWGAEEAALAYWVLGSFVGAAVSQNARGHLLGHVRDAGLDPGDPRTRLYATRAAQPYHTDSADVVGLLCLRAAAEGGASSVTSSVAIHDALLAAERADVVQTLSEPFVVDRKGEVPAGCGPTYPMPVFHRYAGAHGEDLLTCVYARGFIEAAQGKPGVPELTPAQVEALDCFDALAADPALRLDMNLEPGDVQLLHNHSCVHARSAFRDHPEDDRKRHLLRLWLAPPDDRPLPDYFAARYGSVLPGRRGGIRCPGFPLTYSLDPAH